MQPYYNTATGEIIFAKNKSQAKAYFKADGLRNNYAGQTRLYKPYKVNMF